MQYQDLINGLFELMGSLFTWVNIIKLYKDKIVKGVYWHITIFWVAWGILEFILLPLSKSMVEFLFWNNNGRWKYMLAYYGILLYKKE